MKTKIMLALALVAAVALVGTARPVSGTEALDRTTVLAETATPAPAGFDLAAPAVDAQEVTAGKAVVQEQEQEKAKAAEKAKLAEKVREAEKAAQAKAAVAKTFVITPMEVEGKPIEVVITEGDQVRKLVLEKPLTITKSKDGEALVLTIDGKDLEVLKGEPLRLEIKGGELQVIKEGATVVAGTPMKVKLTRKDMKEGESWVIAPDKGVKVVGGTHLKLKKGAWAAEGVEGRPFAWTMAGDDDMLEKVRALQEQVQAIKAQKMDISALEDSLKKLETELQAKEEKLEELKFKIDRVAGEAAIVKKVREAEAESGRVVIREGEAVGAAKARVFVETGDKNEGTINLTFTGQEGEAGRAAFERAVTTLKKELPEGYKLVEQEYDSEDGTMTFKVAGPEGKKTDGALIRKLVETVQEKIKK